MPAVSTICRALALPLAMLALLLPAPWNALALLLCAACAARLCASLAAAKPYRDPNWDIAPTRPDTDPETCEGLVIDPRLLTGGLRRSARVWMGGQPMDGAKLRSLPGAPLFSAACALTLEEALALTGSDPDSLRAWQTAIGIRPERLRAQFPRVEDAKIEGFRGAVVRDGAAERAYFVGSSELMHVCTAILDERGQTRPVLAGDRKRAETLPSGLLCYATSLVEDGKLTGLTWLGGAQPLAEWTPDAEAIAAAQALQETIPLCYDPAAADAEAIAAALMPSLPPARVGARLVTVTPRDPEHTRLHLPEPSVIERWRLHARTGRSRALALIAASLAAALPAAAALCSLSGLNLLPGLLALASALLPCAGFYLASREELRPVRQSPAPALLGLSLLPPFVTALMLALLTGTVEAAALLTAGICAAWGLGLLSALFLTASIRDDETRKRDELILAAAALVIPLLTALTQGGQPGAWLGLLFGLVLGILCGILRQLIARI